MTVLNGLGEGVLALLGILLLPLAIIVLGLPIVLVVRLGIEVAHRLF